MFAIIYLLGTFIADLLKSRRRLEVENLFLRHQLNIILRRPPQRLRLRGSDRALMVWMTRLSFPKIRSGLGSPREAETLHQPGRPDLISGRDRDRNNVIPHASTSCPSRLLRRKISVSAGKSSTVCCEAEGAKRLAWRTRHFSKGEQFDTDAIGG
jgi:hypothetical protein